MRFGKFTSMSVLGSALFLSACTGGSTSTGAGGGTLSAVQQDLAVDPSGVTTRITLPSDPGTLSPANFEANGGQVALAVTVIGNEATVTWDDRVTPSDQVRGVEIPGVGTAYTAVTTSDSTAPTFTVSNGVQGAGVGNDTFDVTFVGPRLIEAEAEDISNWRLAENGGDVNLTGSVFDYDPITGLMSVALGSNAGLHATFELYAPGVHAVSDVSVAATGVNGAAAGDALAPTLVSSAQHLPSDEFGRSVDFVFSEALDPNFVSGLASFQVTLPAFASSITQVAVDTLRVTFTEPMIPTVDSVTVTNLVDFHGNAFITVPAAVTQGSSVANGFTVSPEVRTVENSDNDVVVVVFDQAIDPEDAEDSAHWDLDINAGDFDLSAQDFDFDLLTKTLTISLDADFANGSTFDFGPAVGNPPLDVDGDSFATTFSGTVAGDAALPTIVTLVQNRVVDPSGMLVDVTFSEDVEETTAETLGNWSVSGGITVLTVQRMADPRTVRLTMDDQVIPGDNMVAADLIEDVAGNAMASASGLSVTSSDLMEPTFSGEVASAIEGANNDTVTVAFDDDMIESEVEVPTSWFLESPVGTPMDTSAAVVDYDAASRTATLTLAGGGNFPTREDFSVAMVGMRDIGGNTVDSAISSGNVVAETNYPEINMVWVDASDDNIVHVRLTEPGAHLADYYDPLTNTTALTIYELFDSLGSSLGFPASVTVSADLIQISINFGQSIVAGINTVSVRGLTDLAENQLFPEENLAIASPNGTAPILEVGVSTGLTVSGESNDRLTVVFDRMMCPWGMEDASNYALELLGTPIDLLSASFSFDGDRTVVIDLSELGATNLLTSSTYDVFVTGLCSAQGVAIVGTSSDSLVAAGDSSVPTLEAGRVRMDAIDPANSILIEMSEAIQAADAVDETLVDIAAVNPDFSVRAGMRTARASFVGGTNIGDTVNVSFRDLAGNLGIASQLAVAQDATGPVVTAVSGTVQEGRGGDTVSITFDKPLQTGLALNSANYTIDQGGSLFDLSGLVPAYISGGNTVVFTLAEGQDLDASQQIHVTATGVTDLSGLVMTPADELGAVSGDASAPALLDAFVNLRADFTGRSIDVLLSEDVDPSVLVLPVAWSSTGGQSVMTVQRLQGDVYRVSLLTAPAPGDQLTILPGIEDLAGNAAGSVSVDITM
ncbi:MAG: hypothetical protein ACI9D0_001157 [Bacteroidia bacterium]|jgi:hypothetical protein